MNELTIHDYLQKKGLSEYGIAGLMGNLFAESGLNPRNLQNSYENVLGMNDNAYVAAVDNGTTQISCRTRLALALLSGRFGLGSKPCGILLRRLENLSEISLCSWIFFGKSCPRATPACWRCCGRQPLYWRLPMPCC